MILTINAHREGYAPGIHYCPAEPMLNFRRISVRSRTKACFYIQRTTPRGIAKRPVRNPLADRAKSAALNQNPRLQSAISKCQICTLKDVDEHRPLGFP